MSLISGNFPEKFKQAHVQPLLKKPALSKNEYKNYRPISNLCFISKILEKVVANRLRSHILENKLANQYQSAYRQFHSTETALLKVHNDILLNMDKGQITALTLLDLSAAFDTIDHSILMERLSDWYGITGTALSWFSSYVTNRAQLVKIKDILSEPQSIKCGVPQGSVLGPVLFTLYSTPLSSIINYHKMEHHLYADDTQIYISLSTSDPSASLEKLKLCIMDVFNWMTHSKLKLNPDKTEFLIIGSKKQREKLSSLFPFSLLDRDTSPTTSARNLGVLFDSDFNFRQHISQTCRACYYHIRDLRRIRRHISFPVAKTIANALVSSRLDYCNSLLYNIADKDVSKLQRVQNCLARVVNRAARFTSSAPLLKKLHWLPIQQRIKFKICALTFKTVTSHQPAYLNDLLIPAVKPRSLRSTDTGQLYVPRVKTNSGSRAFSVAAPTIWNSLPIKIRSANGIMTFRRLLKTHLFGIAFPP